MKIIILEHNASDFFSKAQKIEDDHPNGEWRYFKFSANESVLGLYENKDEGINIHPDFFKYFLGQFTPVVKSEFDIVNFIDFEKFCEKLNELLVNNHEILDLSVDQKWIWSVQNKTFKMPSKLKEYLSY